MVRTEFSCGFSQFMAALDLPRPALEAYLGQSVEDFCTCGFGKKGDEHNHCVHFVAHVMDYTFGTVCSQMMASNPANAGKGRTIRVNDLFNNCPVRGLWASKPDFLFHCLIFAVHKDGVLPTTPVTISSQRKKHVGIYLNGSCYNYHNTSSEGVRKDGVDRFTNLYGPGTRVFYAEFP
jgi:glycosidase